MISNKTRDTIYYILYVLNGVLLALSTHDSLPTKWAYAASLVSFVCATVMKQLGRVDPPPSPPSDAVLQ